MKFTARTVGLVVAIVFILGLGTGALFSSSADADTSVPTSTSSYQAAISTPNVSLVSCPSGTPTPVAGSTVNFVCPLTPPAP